MTISIGPPTLPETSSDVINLDEHREAPDVLWFSGSVRCTGCGNEHVAVVQFPVWAYGPRPVECPKCHVNTCLAIRDDQTPEPADPAAERSDRPDSTD